MKSKKTTHIRISFTDKKLLLKINKQEKWGLEFFGDIISELLKAYEAQRK